jgi:phage shock protein C
MNDRLYRSVDDRVIAGVCGGVAVRFALDPSLVRVLWVVVALVTGVVPLLILYVIMAAVVPEEPGGFAGLAHSPTPPDASPGTVEASTAGAPAPPAGYKPSPAARPGRRERREHDPLPTAIGGLVLVALGVYFLVRDRIAIDWGVVGAAGLVALGAVVIIAALRPRR